MSVNGFLFGKVFADVVWDWNLNIMIGVLRREGRGSFNIQKEEDHVKMKTGLEFLLLPSKECLSASEDGRDKKEFFCRAFRDSY